MRSFRRATQRVAPSVAALASILFLATCDLDKITSAKKDNSGQPSASFSICCDSLVTLGGTVSLGVNASVDLTHTAQRWTSSNPAVITTDSTSGALTGISIGTAIITVRLLAPELDTGITASASVRVKYAGLAISGVAAPPADSITSLHQTRTIVVRGTNEANVPQAIVAAVLSGGAGATANDTVFRLETGGILRARKNGSSNLVATFDNLNAQVSVKVRQVAKNITFATPEYIAGSVGRARTLTVTVKDAADSTVPSGSTMNWRANDPTIATINSSTGSLTALKVDTTTIFVTADTVVRKWLMRVVQVPNALTKTPATDAQSAEVATNVATAPQVTVLDSGSTPIVGATVAFSIGLGAGTALGTAAITDALGKGSVGSWKLGTRSGANTLIASAGSATATFTATGLPGAAARLLFAIQPRSTPAATVISPAVRVAVTDSLGNLVPSANNSIAISLGSNTGGATLNGTTIVSATNGIASFTNLSVNNPGGAYTLLANSSGLLTGTSNAFDAFGAANKLGFVVQPSNTVVNQPFSPTVQVAVQDANGNTVTNATNTVTLAIGTNPGGATLNVPVAAVNGIATFTGVVINQPGVGYTLSATATALSAGTSTAFTVAAQGPAVKLGFVNQPTNVVAGAITAAPITVAVQDVGGSTITSATNAVTLSFETNPGSGTLSGTLTRAAVSGVATFNDISINKTGIGYKLSAQATSLTDGSSTTFNVTPGTATKLGYVVQPTHTQVNTAMQPGVQVAVQDALGNTVTAQAATTITLALAGGTTGAVLTPTPTTAQTSGGVATFNTLSVNTAGSGYLLNATSGTFTQAASQQFNILAAGGATKLAFQTVPTVATAGATMSNVVVALKDAAGNTVTTAAPTSVTIALNDNPSGSTLSGTTTVVTSAGLATFSTLSVNKTGTGHTFKVNAAGYAQQVSAAFSVTNNVASQLGFIAQPSNATAGRSIAPPDIKVAVQDANGNTVTTANNSVALSFASNPGGGTLDGTTTVSAVNGVATFSDVRIRKAASNYQLQAASSGVGGAVSGFFNITAGPPSALTFKVQPPATTSAGTTLAPAVEVQVSDSTGNPVAAGASPVTLQLVGGAAGAVLGGTTVVTPTAGIASFSTLTIDKPGIGYRLNASSSGLETAISTAATITGGAPAKLRFTTVPTSMVTNVSATFAVAVQDAAGNTLPGAGTSITLSQTAGPAATLGGTLTQLTNAGGVATFGNITLNTAGTGYRLRATRTDLATPPAYDTTSVAGITVSSQTIAINTGNAQTGTVGANVATAPSVLVTTNGSPAAAVPVQFITSTNGLVNGASNVVVNTNGSGIATLTSWQLRTLAGQDTMFARINATPEIIVRFTATANPGAAFAMTVVSGNGQTADVGTQVPIAPAVRIADAFNNSVVGSNVTFTPGAGSGSVVGSPAATNAGGIATLTSWTLGPAAGTHTLTAALNSLTQGFTATATSVDPCAQVTPFSLTGGTVNGTLAVSDCQRTVNTVAGPVDKYGLTLAQGTFFSLTSASSAFLPRFNSFLYPPSTFFWFSDNNPPSSPLTVFYLTAAGSYTVEQGSSTASATGSYSITPQINPSLPNDCLNALVTKNVVATFTLSTTACTFQHNTSSSIPNQTSSTRRFLLVLAANTSATIHMTSGTLDAYLEAFDISGASSVFLGYDDDSEGGTDSKLVIAATGVTRFIEIRAMHYTVTNTPLNGSFVLVIDP